MTTRSQRYKIRYYLHHQPRKGGLRWASILDALRSLKAGEKLRVIYPQDMTVQLFQVNLINQITRKINDKAFRTWRVSASILVERTE